MIYYHSECCQGKSQKRTELMLLPAGISLMGAVQCGLLLGPCMHGEGAPTCTLLPSARNLPRPLEARPAIMHQNSQVLGALPAVHASHHPAARLNHQENRDPIAWKTINKQHYTVRCSQFDDHPSQGSWTRLCPNHRVAMLSITCSVRDMGNYLLSTY